MESRSISFSPCRKLVWNYRNENRREEVGSNLCVFLQTLLYWSQWPAHSWYLEDVVLGVLSEASTCLQCRFLTGHLLSHECGVVLFSLCVLLITATLSREARGKMNTVCQENLPGGSCVTGLCACVSPLQGCFHLPHHGLSLLRTWHCYHYV